MIDNNIDNIIIIMYYKRRKFIQFQIIDNKSYYFS